MNSDSESDVDSSTLDFQPMTLAKELFPERQFGSENVEKNASKDRELSIGTNTVELDEEYCQSHMSGHTDSAGQSAIFSDFNRTHVQASQCFNESEHIPHLQQEFDYSLVESLSEPERNSRSGVNPPQKSFESWQRLVAVLAVTGTNRLTSDQYEFFRNTINWALQSYAPREKLLPSFSTIQHYIFPSLLRNNFPDCNMFNMPVNMNKAGARASIMKKVTSIDARESGQASLPPADENLPKAAVLVINPSAWAEMDVSCKPTWDLLKLGTADEGRCDLTCPHFNTIARAPIVSQRSDVLQRPHFAIFRQDRTAITAKTF